MVRCQEMSQITPTIALVAASTTATTYHGRPTAPALARPVETAAVLISYRSPEPPDTSPLPRHFSKIFFACSCASSSACLALIRPVAAFANMVGRTNVSKISLSAGFAGPGCPMFVAHFSAVLIGLRDRKSTRLNSSHTVISYAVFCLKKKKKKKKADNRQY